MVKICKQCKIEKDLEANFVHYPGRIPYSRFCIECLSTKKSGYWTKSYHKHRDKRLEIGKRWREKNKESHIEICKEWARKHPIERWLASVKKRAKEKGLEFTITIDDLIIPEFCPILGIPIFRQGKKASPNSPSIDRLDSTKGYTKDNVQIISRKANTIKNDATLSELIMVGEWAKLQLLEESYA